MKVATKIFLVMALLVALFAGVAVAATFTCLATTCNGTNQNDRITGGNNNQTFNARAGNDIVAARGGNDTVNGEAGNDRLTGEGACDKLNGGSGTDLLDNATGDNCSQSLDLPSPPFPPGTLNPNREIANSVDTIQGNDGIITNDNRPDEILCDPDDLYRADANIDRVNSQPALAGSSNLCP